MFSIVIQGPLNRISLTNIDVYKRFGKVIVSHWDTDDPKLFDGIELDGVEVVSSSPKIESTTFNAFNCWYHFYSTLKGFERVSTEFAIKVRSDNSIGNLQPLMDRILEFPDRYVSSDLYFRPDSAQKFCPSDQFFGSRTTLLLETLRIICFRLEKQSGILKFGFNDHRQTSNDYYIFKGRDEKMATDFSMNKPGSGRGVSPEVLIGTSFLAAKKESVTPEDSKELMKRNFEIVPTEILAPYVGKDGTSNIPHAGPEIQNINDI